MAIPSKKSSASQSPMIRLIANALILAGLLLIGGYIWAAVIVPWGDPDQSLLFWYLFIFLLGALAVKAGLRKS